MSGYKIEILLWNNQGSHDKIWGYGKGASGGFLFYGKREVGRMRTLPIGAVEAIDRGFKKRQGGYEDISGKQYFIPDLERRIEEGLFLDIFVRGAEVS